MIIRPASPRTGRPNEWTRAATGRPNEWRG